MSATSDLLPRPRADHNDRADNARHDGGAEALKTTLDAADGVSCTLELEAAASLNRNEFKQLSEYYHREAQWSSDKYMPSFAEHVELSIMSSGYQMLGMVALVGVHDGATVTVEEDFPGTVECYMEEHGVDWEAAMVAVAALAEHAWRTINRARIEVDPARLLAAQLVVNLTRVLEVMYHCGQDRYTFATDLKGIITNLFLDPVPM
ncbi:hypothetical protein ABZP36_006677 [Zizania latifolia]